VGEETTVRTYFLHILILSEWSHALLLSVLTLYSHKAGHVLGFDHPDTSPGENLEQVGHPETEPEPEPEAEP
jgi:hypothetical protein